MLIRAAGTYLQLRLGVGAVLCCWALALTGATACSVSVPLRRGNGYFVVENQGTMYSGDAAYERRLWGAGGSGRYRLRLAERNGERGLVIAGDAPLYGDTLFVGNGDLAAGPIARTWSRFEPHDDDGGAFSSDSGKMWTVSGFDIRMIEFRLFLSRRDSNGVKSVILKGGMGLGLK